MKIARVDVRGARPWVRDLMRRQIIGRPYPVKKSVGRGQGVRFRPADYRALIEILLLRSRGHKHRSTWLVWLWLRGRDYPLDRVRAAVTEDVAANVKAVRAELNPTGRSTEPFVTKYRRNVAPSRSGSPFPGLGGLEETFAALMMRPHEAPQIPIDMDALSVLASQALDVDEDTMRRALQDLVKASQDQEDVQEWLLRFADVLQPGAVRTVVEMLAQADPAELPPPPNLSGLIDDGRGNSALLSALNSASDEQLLEARRQIQLIRTGRFERALRDAALTAPAEQANMLIGLADWARIQRELHRCNPAMAAYLLSVHVTEGGDRVPVSARRPLDVSSLLRAFRDQAL